MVHSVCILLSRTNTTYERVRCYFEINYGVYFLPWFESLNNRIHLIIYISAVSRRGTVETSVSSSSPQVIHFQPLLIALLTAHKTWWHIEMYSFSESVSLSYKQLRSSVLHDKPATKLLIPTGGLDFIRQTQVQTSPLTILDFLMIHWSRSNIFQRQKAFIVSSAWSKAIYLQISPGKFYETLPTFHV